MASKNKRRDMVIPWPFAPSETDLNKDTDLLKIIAMVCMFCDHAGKVLLPQYPIMRVIGRLAFPIYAYCIAVGCIYTHDVFRYLKRLALVAIISQPIYCLALEHASRAMFSISFAEHPFRAAINFYVQSWHYPSIMLTLAFGLLVIWTIREREMLLLISMLLLCWWTQGKINYGFRGIMLILLFYLFSMKWWLSLPVVLAYMVWWGLRGSGYTLFEVRFGSQAFAILALPFIYIHMNTGIRVNKWFFYFFYPAHMVVIYFLKHFVLQ
ncbi:MAG: hypothetical protein IJH78_03580 [Clostridia bacterium]|nr:hypothetical protein [Clostridia bacterium]